MQKLIELALLEELDLAIVQGRGSSLNEQCLELRIRSTGDFVAWFRTTMKESSGDVVSSYTAQFVERKTLSAAQKNYVRNWVEERTKIALKLT